MGPICLWHRGLAGGVLAGGVGAGVGRQPEWAHGCYRVRAPRTRTEATEGTGSRARGGRRPAPRGAGGHGTGRRPERRGGRGSRAAQGGGDESARGARLRLAGHADGVAK